MDLLFENIERTYDGPAFHNEESFAYYQRSSRKDIGIIRDKINKWFSEYPDDEKYELKKRFKKDFDSSFYELYLYILFKKLDFEVIIHPNISGSSKKPDFLIVKNNLEIYIEAKIVYDKTSQEMANERKINELYDQLDKIKCPGFLLQLETLILKSTIQPSTRKLVKYIQNEISKLNPEIVTQHISTYGFNAIPNIKYEDDNINVVIKPIPVIESARDIVDRRALGMFPLETFWGGNSEALKSSIKMKAKRYGVLDQPFVVCMNMLASKGTMFRDAQEAVWGSPAISWSTDPNNRDERWMRQKDGAFLDEKGPRLKNLSGIFVTRVFPFNIPNPEHCIFQNPFTNNALEFSIFNLRTEYVENGKIISEDGKKISDVLQISENWID